MLRKKVEASVTLALARQTPPSIMYQHLLFRQTFYISTGRVSIIPNSILLPVIDIVHRSGKSLSQHVFF